MKHQPKSFGHNMAYHKENKQRIQQHMKNIVRPQQTQTTSIAHKHTRPLPHFVKHQTECTLSNNINTDYGANHSQQHGKSYKNQIEGIIAIAEEKIINVMQKQLNEQQERNNRLVQVNQVQTNDLKNTRRELNKNTMKLQFALEEVSKLKHEITILHSKNDAKKDKIEELEMEVKFSCFLIYEKIKPDIFIYIFLLY